MDMHEAAKRFFQQRRFLNEQLYHNEASNDTRNDTSKQSSAESAFTFTARRETPATSISEEDFVDKISDTIQNKIPELEPDELVRLKNVLQDNLIQVDSLLERNRAPDNQHKYVTETVSQACGIDNSGQGLSIDSGASQGQNLDAILNPVEYYKALDMLEKETAQLCHLDRSDYDYQSSQNMSRHERLSVLKGCLAAFRNLRAHGFCGDIFTVFIENPHRPDTAEGVHIPLEEIEELIRFLSVERPPTRGCPEAVLSLVTRLRYPSDRNENLFGYLRFLCTALPLSIVSFSGSHACEFDLSIWGRSVDKIPVGLGYSFARRRLACLSEFIGGPVWVLGKDQNIHDHVSLKVSLTVQDLQQLWGPVWMVGGTEDAAPILRTERGYIIPHPMHLQYGRLSDEVICHWTEDLPVSFTDSEERVTIQQTSRLLVGAATDEDKTRFTVNNQCKPAISLIQQHIATGLHLPGTCKAHYVQEGHEVTLTGGYFISAGIAKKWKRMPARTHKSALIEHCTKPDAELLPILKLQVGLEISACTGNSQRVSLWDAICLSQIKLSAWGSEPQTQCGHSVGSIECVTLCWNRGLRDQFHDTIDIPDSHETLGRVYARRKIIDAILELKHTGINSEGQLLALWPFSECPHVCHIPPTAWGRENKWLPIVEDTLVSSTFAVLSPRCLGLNHKIGISGCFEPYITQSVRTALCTRAFTTKHLGKGKGIGLGHGDQMSLGNASLEVTEVRSKDPLAVVATVKRKRVPNWRGKQHIEIQEQISPDIATAVLLSMIAY